MRLQRPFYLAAVVLLGLTIAGCGQKEPKKEEQHVNPAQTEEGAGWTIFEPVGKSAGVEGKKHE